MPGLREQKKLETRQRIIDTAWQLFKKHGFKTTTIDQIAKAARVGTGTFYNYFPSKEHVIAAYFAQDLQPVLDRIDAAKSSGDSFTDIVAIIDQVADFMMNEPALMREAMGVFFSMGVTAEEEKSSVTNELIQMDFEVLQRVQTVLETGKTRGDIGPEVNEQLASMTIYSLFAMVWIAYLFKSIPTKPEAMGAFAAMLSLVFDGLKGGRS